MPVEHHGYKNFGNLYHRCEKFWFSRQHMPAHPTVHTNFGGRGGEAQGYTTWGGKFHLFLTDNHANAIRVFLGGKTVVHFVS